MGNPPVPMFYVGTPGYCSAVGGEGEGFDLNNMFNAERSGFDCNAEHCSQDGNTFSFLGSTLERRDGKFSSFQCSMLERRGTALRWIRGRRV